MKNKKTIPKVSIIIPVYNGENYILEAIESALAQTYKNIEIIVVNDGSNDNTEEIISKYLSKIKYIKKINGGVSTALNEGIKNMSGDYFSWLSHDDIYLPNKIEEQIKYLSCLEEREVILYNDYALMDAKGKRYSKNIILDKKMLLEKPEYGILRGCINGITLLIPKKAFDLCGYFDESLKCTQDYDMWDRISKKFKFVYMNKILTVTRIHSNQDTQKNPNVLLEGNILWKKLIESVSNEKKIELEGNLFNYYYSFALFLNKSFNKEAMKYCVDKCVEIDPLLYANKNISRLKKEALIKKIIRHIKNDGIINSIKIFFARLKRRR